MSDIYVRPHIFRQLFGKLHNDLFPAVGIRLIMADYALSFAVVYAAGHCQKRYCIQCDLDLTKLYPVSHVLYLIILAGSEDYLIIVVIIAEIARFVYAGIVRAYQRIAHEDRVRFRRAL